MGGVNNEDGPSLVSERHENEVDVGAVLEELAALDPTVPLIVDLDETLLLTNSTEEYLDSLRPRILGHALLMLLGLGRPWVLWPSDRRNDARDVIRVLAATVLLPWTRLLWTAKARHLGRDKMNPDLMTVITARAESPTVVATNGFTFVVKPILHAAGLGEVPLTAVGLLTGIRDRARGKPSRTIDHIGEDALRRSVVVTDSPVDQELVNAANRGFIVRWPEAVYRKAMSDHYLPFVYLDQVKHPGQQFFLKTVIADDWLVSVLAIAWIADDPLKTAAGMLLLMLGWWTIYEVGYHENDRVAETLESDPALRPDYFQYAVTPSWRPWPWALGMTALGAAILASTERSTSAWLALLQWIGLIVLTRLAFGGYNRVDKRTRAWIYPLLHLPRTYGLLLLLPVGIGGAMALGAQLLSRWTAYLVYRTESGKWPGASYVQLTRLLMFLLLAAPVGAALGWSQLLNPQMAAILLWFGIRARRGLLTVARSGARL